MSYAIYGESLGYVHLVASECEDAIVSQFIVDVENVGVNLKDVYNVIAVKDSSEYPDLEDRIFKLIKEARNVVQ